MRQFQKINGVLEGEEWGNGEGKKKLKDTGDFRSGPEVKNLPASAGDMGSVFGLWSFHIYWAHALEPTSHSAVLHNKRSHRNKKPVRHNEE